MKQMQGVTGRINRKKQKTVWMVQGNAEHQDEQNLKAARKRRSAEKL